MMICFHDDGNGNVNGSGYDERDGDDSPRLLQMINPHYSFCQVITLFMMISFLW